MGGVAVKALTIQEHEEAVGLLVREGDGQGAGGAGELVSIEVELEVCIHGENIGWERRIVKKNMA